MSLSHHPALPLMTGRQATAGKSGTFPQGAWADTQGGEHSLSAEVEEKEQRGTKFPESALGLGDGVRRARGSTKTSASGRVAFCNLEDLCKRATRVLKKMSLRATSSSGSMPREWKTPGPLQW